MKTLDKKSSKTLPQPVVKLKSRTAVAKPLVAKKRVAKVPVAKAPVAKAPVAKATGAKTVAPKSVGARVSSRAQKAAGAKSENGALVSKAPKSANGAPATKANGAAKTKDAKPEAGVSKAKRTRVPADLAAQYGERTNLKAEARPAVPEAKPRRPRRDAAARAKLKELLRPDETFVERLARANSVSAPRRVTTRRSKNWRTRCGKCGTEGSFAIAAALCSRCGTILLRAD